MLKMVNMTIQNLNPMIINEKQKYTMDACIAYVKELNKGKDINEEWTREAACMLYLCQRLSFWDDFPILFEVIEREKNKAIIKYREKENV